MSIKRSKILQLFNRLAEPVHVSKGRKKNFNIPASYSLDRYKNVASEVLECFEVKNSNQINVKRIKLPDLSIPMKLGRRKAFSLFIPAHRKIAGHLIDIFLGIKTYDDFLSVAIYARDRLNTVLFIYCLSVAILHRPDTKNLLIPPLIDIFPSKYMDNGTFAKVIEGSHAMPAGSREPIEIPRDYTASDFDAEHRVAYFREDVGINLHHWHWYLVFPIDANLDIVNKDRRGELFYYMHEQIMARYNTERLCNRLGFVEKLTNLRDSIPEAYFPKLNSLVSNRNCSSRTTRTKLHDGDRPVDELQFDIAVFETWTERIYDAIHDGAVTNTRGHRIPLDEKEGIDILGNIIEANILSADRSFYGDLHNLGHLIMACVHDSDDQFSESFGMMGDPATAMRDPIFYSWHAFINDIFMEHKNLLPPYGLPQLQFSGIEVQNIQVVTPNQSANVLTTFWDKSDIDLSKNLDFSSQGDILARFTHLNHAPFTYKIDVNNSADTPQMGTCRIFLGPQLHEHGEPFSFLVQKNLMIEMDKFTVSLEPGMNFVSRNSTQSTVTIPFERTFRNLDERPENDETSLANFIFCGCGWPHHMLLPKGTKEGFKMDLFVMISDYKNDAIVKDVPTGGTDAFSFCGLRDGKYPDARSMGYPFDRMPRTEVSTMTEFLTPNMRVTEVTVLHIDTVQVCPQNGDDVPNGLPLD